MKIKLIIFLLLIGVYSYFLYGKNENGNFIKIKKIVYLTPDVLDENVLKTYLGFKENKEYTLKQWEILIESAKLRLEKYGAFNEIKILTKNVENTSDENEKIVFIELTKGFDKAINADLYWFQYGWKNFLHRGDYIGFVAGINRNIFEGLHHLPPGWLSISHQTGWTFFMEDSYFPFFSLVDMESRYIHEAFSTGQLNFILHPDLKIGIYAGVNNWFSNQIKNRENFCETPYTFAYERTGLIAGIFFELDKRLFAERYKVGFRYSFRGGINADILGKNIYPELKNEFKIAALPCKYFHIINELKLYNQITNNNEITKYYINNPIYQRGKINTSTTRGNFLFSLKNDFRFPLPAIDLKSFFLTFGFNTFYDGIIITDDSTILNNPEFIQMRHTVGGGFWAKFGKPVDFTVFVDVGYTILESSNDIKISITMADYF